MDLNRIGEAYTHIFNRKPSADGLNKQDNNDHQDKQTESSPEKTSTEIIKTTHMRRVSLKPAEAAELAAFVSEEIKNFSDSDIENLYKSGTLKVMKPQYV